MHDNVYTISDLLSAATEEIDGQIDVELSEHQVVSETEGGVAGTEPNVQSGANSQITTERHLSYELATEEEDIRPKRGGKVFEGEGGEVHAVNVMEELAPPPPHPQDNRQRKAGGGGGGKRISRSTSSPSAGARIRLQETMGLRSIPGVGAAHSPLLLRSSISTSRSGLSASFPSPGQKSEEKARASSRMAKLLESEFQTGSYSCPLVGCIPASALKYFAEKEERKGLNSTSPQSSTSPSLVYEQSGMCM
jgi:hypothetical protein